MTIPILKPTMCKKCENLFPACDMNRIFADKLHGVCKACVKVDAQKSRRKRLGVSNKENYKRLKKRGMV